jgi:hypothetical protein
VGIAREGTRCRARRPRASVMAAGGSGACGATEAGRAWGVRLVRFLGVARGAAGRGARTRGGGGRRRPACHWANMPSSRAKRRARAARMRACSAATTPSLAACSAAIARSSAAMPSNRGAWGVVGGIDIELKIYN